MSEQPRTPPDPVRDAIAIYNNPQLDNQRKLTLLRELELDARLRSVASDENMRSQQTDGLAPIQQLIAELTKRQAG